MAFDIRHIGSGLAFGTEAGFVGLLATRHSHEMLQVSIALHGPLSWRGKVKCSVNEIRSNPLSFRRVIPKQVYHGPGPSKWFATEVTNTDVDCHSIARLTGVLDFSNMLLFCNSNDLLVAPTVFPAVVRLRSACKAGALVLCEITQRRNMLSSHEIRQGQLASKNASVLYQQPFTATMECVRSYCCLTEARTQLHSNE